MTPEVFSEIEQIITHQISQVESRLQAVLSGQAVLTSTLWWQPTPLSLNGALYIRPNGLDTEQPIDALFTTVLNQPNQATFSVYIEWADGTDISRVADHELSYISPSHLATQISEIINPLANQLFQELKELLSRPLPPRFDDW